MLETEVIVITSIVDKAEKKTDDKDKKPVASKDQEKKIDDKKDSGKKSDSKPKEKEMLSLEKIKVRICYAS